MSTNWQTTGFLNFDSNISINTRNLSQYSTFFSSSSLGQLKQIHMQILQPHFKRPMHRITNSYEDDKNIHEDGDKSK